MLSETLEVANRKTSRRGKKVKMYKTVLKKTVILFEDGEFKVEFKYPGQKKEKAQLEFE